MCIGGLQPMPTGRLDARIALLQNINMIARGGIIRFCALKIKSELTMTANSPNICCAGGLQPPQIRLSRNRISGPTRAKEFSQTCRRVATPIVTFRNTGRSIHRDSVFRCASKSVSRAPMGGDLQPCWHFQAHYPKREIMAARESGNLEAFDWPEPPQFSIPEVGRCRQSHRGLAVPDVTKAGKSCQTNRSHRPTAGYIWNHWKKGLPQYQIVVTIWERAVDMPGGKYERDTETYQSRAL